MKIFAYTKPIYDFLLAHTLAGTNYMDWKLNLYMLLTMQENKYVLDKPCLKISDGTSIKTRKDFKKWIQANSMGLTYMRTSYMTPKI